MASSAKALVVVSALVAVGWEAVSARNAWANLPLATAVCFAVGLLARASLRRFVVGVILIATYTLPGVFLLSLGVFYFPFNVVWIAALLGAALASVGPIRWSLPRPWRLPLAFWALVVALAWPVIVLREHDFMPSLLGEFRLVVNPYAAPAKIVSEWIAHVAASQMVGILWFDALFAAYPPGEWKRFQREILVPLGVSWVLSGVVGIYQLFADVSFLNPGFFTVLRRASGTMYDANPFGVIAALWGPIAVSLTFVPARRWKWLLAGVALPFSWFGVWASGSRNALLMAVVGLASLLYYGWRRAPTPALRVRLLAGVAALTIAAAGTIWITRVPVVGPVERVLETVRGRSLGAFLYQFWDRTHYGGAGHQMIRDHPLVGVGVGAFHSLVTDYAFSMPDVRLRLPPDNAQNWFRHQLAELGLLGSLGWIAWTLLCARLLVTVRPPAERQLPARVARVLLIALAMVSLVGMPTQNVAVALTFWTIAFWFVIVADGPSLSPEIPARRWPAWPLVWIAALGHMGGTAHVARHDLRVPNRAIWGEWEYEYGLYAAEQVPEGAFRWTRDRAVTVIRVEKPWLRLTLWASHPDLASTPVAAQVWVAEQLVFNARLRDTKRVVRYVPMPQHGGRVLIETRVERTWRPADYGRGADSRDLGVALAWEFVDSPP